jgi:hypothetical protein
MPDILRRFPLLIAAAFAVGFSCCAQTPARFPAKPPAPFVSGNLGKAYSAIDGLWAFHPGDNPEWASPDFNDADWPQIETGRPWEGQGFHDLTGFAWYRRRVVLTPSQISEPGWQLGLVLPGIEDAAEVYWNGRLAGTYGKLPPDPVWYDQTGSGITDISPHFSEFVPLGRPQSGTLAIRVWKAPYVYYSFPDEGGLTGVPLLGSTRALAEHGRARWYQWLRANLWQFAVALLSGLVSLLALLAWLRNRGQRMLLWLAIYCLHPLALLPILGIPGLLSFRWGYGLVAPVICIEDISLWFLLLYLLGLRNSPRLVRWTWWMAAIAVCGNFGDGALQLFQWTTWPDHLFLTLDVGITIPALIVEAWGAILVLFAFRRRLDAARWLLAIIAVLTDFFQALGNWFSLGVRWTHWEFWIPFQRPLFSILGNQVDIQSILNTLLLAAIVYAVWCYQAEQTSRQNRLDEEFRNAQELQQLLVPDSVTVLPGYSISSVYKPATEVGGDFFQVIPCDRPANAALLVVGDVSGKGLKAAMTVSLIVGALRALAESTNEPAVLLTALNRRLHERLRGGFCTCVAVRVDPDGRCLIANAGHLPPYRNGEEVSVESGLPLGVTSDVRYVESALSLAAGETLTFLSDGVVEARNARGELFGFDRTRSISTQSAEAIAQAAQAFGQQDDITVLTLTYAPAEVLHA